MKLANFSVDRPITIFMLMIALVIMGGIAVPLLPVDLYPNMDIPTANVSVSWPGASPTQVEQQVIKPIEAAMATIANVSTVNAVARTGGGNVTVQFNFGTDIQEATLTMRDRLERVNRQLPDGVDAPIVSRADPNSQPIMSMAVYGADIDPITLRELADNIVSPAVQRVDGVGSVGVSGGRTRQIQVLLDPNKLTQYNIPFSAVTGALSNDNQSMDAGLVYRGQQLVPLKLDGEFMSTAEIEKVQVSIGRGQSVNLSELGQIIDTYQDVTQDARRDGQTAVSLSVLKQSDGNTVKVADGIRAAIPSIEEKLPAGVKVAVLNDTSVFIKRSITTVVEHTLLGAVFSIIVLYLFLNSVRATLVIGVVIPISVISTFSMMYFGGQTINVITLGGLALGLGSLVDFAVVVLESIYRKQGEGLPPIEAAKQGAKEVGTAVLASALAQIAVFAPTIFITGLVKNFFAPMAYTVSFSHVAALFAAITLVPMLAAKMLRSQHHELPLEGKTRHPAVLFGRGIHRFTLGYAKVLRWSLNHKAVIIGVTVLLLGGSVFLSRFVGSELTPRTDEGQFSVFINLPTGTKFEITNELASRMEEKLQELPEVETIFTSVGSSGGGAFQSSATNTANISVTLRDDRARSTEQIVELARSFVQAPPGGNIGVFARTSGGLPGLGGGGGGGGDIQVNLNGPDLQILSKLADMVVEELQDVEGIRNPRNTLDRSIPQFNLTVNREAATHYGVSVREVMTSLRTAYQGQVATNFKAGDSQIAVLVRFPTEFTNNLENLNQMVITTSSGTQVPLNAVAAVEPGSGPAQIRHVNQQRLASVTAAVFNVPLGDATKAVEERIATIQPPDGYSITMGGSRNDMNSSFKSLYWMLALSIVLVYMVMASQFESLYGPFIIMFSLPPTFVGAILGLYLTGRTINMNSVMGMIMLVGIVVNNAIVLIDYTNQLRKRGLPLREALMEAGQIRLRPILMTTATTVLAMLPLVIGFGEGAETQASMATVIAFGLTLSTMITLVLVPVVYVLMDEWIENGKRRFGRKPRGPQPLAAESPLPQ